MKKAAVLMAEGYEEGETLTVVDLLRRAGVECHTFSFGEDFVKSTHGMYIKADKVFSDEVKDYDLIFLPGGNPGGIHLRENPAVLDMVRWFDAQGKYVVAMCMGTTVHFHLKGLEEAGIIRGRNVTGYTGYAEKLKSGVFSEDVVVQDGNLITSQGPATPWPLAFLMAELLGGDAETVRTRTLYSQAGGI